MIFSTMSRIRRPIVTIMVGTVLLWCAEGTSLAKEMSNDDFRIVIKTVEVQGDLVIITYDLVGQPEKTYAVAIVLFREKDKNFKVIPKAVSGNIGVGKFAGTGRVVVWDHRKDFPQGLSGNDFYFEILAEITGNSNTWIYYMLGGAAALAGGGAFYLQNQKKQSPPGSQELPVPPARPSQ